ncbi:MAG: flagellar biosynthetic protein FliO [Cyanobacteria bacterium]|nr:flagellar biosynthetic protein FliO [Cyanobacteriota bacterium]
MAFGESKGINIGQDSDKNINVNIDSALIPNAHIKRKEDSMVIQIPDSAFANGFDLKKLKIDPALKPKITVEHVQGEGASEKQTVVTIQSNAIYLNINSVEPSGDIKKGGHIPVSSVSDKTMEKRSGKTPGEDGKKTIETSLEHPTPLDTKKEKPQDSVAAKNTVSSPSLGVIPKLSEKSSDVKKNALPKVSVKPQEVHQTTAINPDIFSPPPQLKGRPLHSDPFVSPFSAPAHQKSTGNLGQQNQKKSSPLSPQSVTGPSDGRASSTSLPWFAGIQSIFTRIALGVLNILGWFFKIMILVVGIFGLVKYGIPFIKSKWTPPGESLFKQDFLSSVPRISAHFGLKSWENFKKWFVQSSFFQQRIFPKVYSPKGYTLTEDSEEIASGKWQSSFNPSSSTPPYETMAPVATSSTQSADSVEDNSITSVSGLLQPMSGSENSVPMPLSIIHSIPLDSERTLHLVQVCSKQIIIASSATDVRIVTEISKEELLGNPDTLNAAFPQSPSSTGSEASQASPVSDEAGSFSRENPQGPRSPFSTNPYRRGNRPTSSGFKRSNRFDFSQNPPSSTLPDSSTEEVVFLKDYDDQYFPNP